VADIPRSADLLVEMITGSPEYLEGIKKDPKGTLAKVAKLATRTLPPPAFVSDHWTYRVVVGALGLVAVFAVLGAIFLSTMPSPAIPDVLTALGAAAIGALAGLLAPSPK
jgi:hypothetical protein